MKAGEIINRALNLSGILSGTLEEQDSEEGSIGLFWLNMLLAEKSATGVLLPYFGHIEISAVPSQEVYYIPNLVTAEVLTFTLNNVRYSVKGQSRNKYFGSPRAENVNSLPFNWYWERVNGGMNIYLYFFPAQAYNLKITGLIGFSKVIFSTELDKIMDDFYQNFLIFELAQSLCLAYKLSLPPETALKLKALKKQITTINPRDFRLKKKSLLGAGGILTYAQINISPGWTSP